MSSILRRSEIAASAPPLTPISLSTRNAPPRGVRVAHLAASVENRRSSPINVVLEAQKEDGEDVGGVSIDPPEEPRGRDTNRRPAAVDRAPQERAQESRNRGRPHPGERRDDAPAECLRSAITELAG